MSKGTVKFFNDQKGYGFIIDTDTKEEIFVHAKGVISGVTLKENDEVTFETEETKKGTNAINVEKV